MRGARWRGRQEGAGMLNRENNERIRWLSSRVALRKLK